MNALPSVLIFTFAEHGQANVNLAATYELALGGVDVCIASFASLKARVLRLQKLVASHASRSGVNSLGSVTFHECSEIMPYWDGLEKHGINSDSLCHPHGVLGALGSYSNLDVIVCPWSLEEYRAGIESIQKIVRAMKPDIVVIDLLFYLARDACALMGQKFMIIMPNSIREVAGGIQPHGAVFWKYPAISSGFPFPLQWWQIPFNIYLVIRLAVQSMSSVHTKKIEALRSALGLEPMFGGKASSGVAHICPSLLEIDFPYALIPQELHLCGPIVMPSDSLEESDPALLKWLDSGPTVMINLGSHVGSNVKSARETASAIRIMIDYHDRKRSNKIQVLWKAMATGDIHTVIDHIIGKEILNGRVKVVAWLDPEPASILEHPNVICTVHHGGANSFYEGIWSGTPHIVLPVWLDTYEYATRAEFLNVGVLGNKSAAPSVQAEEFGQALVRVTGDGAEAARFRSEAKRLREICRSKGNGRELAAAAIVRELGMRK